LKSIAVVNIGVQILNILTTPNYFDYIVVELSSYQIEVLDKGTVFDYGVILNIQPDHLDRYDSFIDYKNAKLKLANHSKTILYDKESTVVNDHTIAFPIDLKDFHIKEINTDFFTFKNQNKIYRIDTPFLKGIHNVKNIMYLLKLLEIMNCNISFENLSKFLGNH
jgi:UDP-N-acetylmuramoylalanine--D-glutamate ligase